MRGGLCYTLLVLSFGGAALVGPQPPEGDVAADGAHALLPGRALLATGLEGGSPLVGAHALAAVLPAAERGASSGAAAHAPACAGDLAHAPGLRPCCAEHAPARGGEAFAAR